MLNADSLDLIAISHFGVYPATRTYRVSGDARTFLKADRHPNAFKMIPITNGEKGQATWIPRHKVSR